MVLALWLGWGLSLRGEVPESLVADGIPELPAALKERAGPYLEFRTASMQAWHPVRREMVVLTRFAESAQLHRVEFPGGARRQLTFLSEPVSEAQYRPVTGDSILFRQDRGGGEFFQLYRYDVADGRVTLLTDGKSRNTGAVWSRDGRWVAWSSTRRNGRDTDIWVMDPDRPLEARMLLECRGGGWGVSDWSEDGTRLLVGEYVSINEAGLHLLEVASGRVTPLTGRETNRVSYAEARFSRDGRSVYCTTDRDGEFLRLVRIDIGTRRIEPLLSNVPWDVDFVEVSPDGKLLAVVTNEDGASVLRILDAKSGRERRWIELPRGVIGGLEWHPNGRDLGFTLAHARSPADAHSVDVRTGKVTRWTESETGGLDAGRFPVPEWVRVKSFDGRMVSGLLYRPDPRRHPGPRPVLVSIHGGPESQSRPVFQGRNNLLLQELGVAILFPNVRGSHGYGKTFLKLDNGFLREDSVRDIEPFLDWIGRDPGLDAGRMAVSGGSYGGYMSLACLTRYPERFRCGIDIVGISNFVTFLERTQEYRRDLRRVEYGDERDPEMRAFLESISPLTQVGKIRVPLLVVQGFNDPRVPVGEAEQIVKAVRDGGGTCWYLLARDEGHGFAKKRNVDFQFHTTIRFLEEHLLR
jgi:dipeptidyl aminopeptidase/acylaminoacyl peptidase